MVRLLITSILITLLAGVSRAGDWSDLTPLSGPTPTARTQSSAILDTQNRRMVVFGGHSTSGPLNDVWAFDLDGHTWTNLTPASGSAPEPRFTPASVYDPVHHRMITWSGQGSGAVFFNDVWSFDLATNAWTEHLPTGGPPNSRYGVAAVFDPVGRDLVTFAGFTDQGRFHDVWRFGADAVTWTDVSAMTGPVERCLHTASYDARGRRMIMYGGQKSGPLDDIWAFDLGSNAWTELTPAVRPGGRFFAASIYDSVHHGLIVFGGTTSGGKTNEVWSFDLGTLAWQLLTPAGTAPSMRDGSSAVYDRAQDRLLIFAGHDGVRRNDVWALENLSHLVDVPQPRPQSVRLRPNAPNPFHRATQIFFDLPRGTDLRLRVFDVRGRLVRRLIEGFRPAGPNAVTWDGKDDLGRAVSAGVYVCQLESGGESEARKIVLSK